MSTSDEQEWIDRRERAARALGTALNDGANPDELGVGMAMAEAALDYLEDRPALRSALLYWLLGLAADAEAEALTRSGQEEPK